MWIFILQMFQSQYLMYAVSGLFVRVSKHFSRLSDEAKIISYPRPCGHAANFTWTGAGRIARMPGRPPGIHPLRSTATCTLSAATRPAAAASASCPRKTSPLPSQSLLAQARGHPGHTPRMQHPLAYVRGGSGREIKSVHPYSLLLVA